MLFKVGADFLLLVHLAFICFVLLGGFLLLRWRWLIVVHIPALLWAILLEFQGWNCPLTPLEQALRSLGDQQGYTGGFIQHYILALIYPAALEQDIQFILGVLLILINTCIYLWIALKFNRKNRRHS